MANFWPEVDDFNNDASTPWQYPSRYLMVSPFASSTSTGGVTYVPAKGSALCNIGGDAAMSGYYGSEETDSVHVTMNCVVERSVVVADSEVYADFVLEVFPEVVLSGADTGFLRGYFLYSRVSGGTSDDGSGGTYITSTKMPGITSPNGIFFGHVKTFTGADQFVLGRLSVSGGMFIDHAIDVQDVFATTLGQVGGLGGTAPHLGESYGFYKPMTLRMVCVGTSVKCYARVRGGNRVNSPAEVKVFDEVTTVTAAGRCGLGPQLPVNLGSGIGQAGMRCRWFQVKDPSGGLIFRDEWSRTNIEAGYLVPSYSSLIQNGHTLMSAYTGDGFGVSDNLEGTGLEPHYFHQVEDAANDRVILGQDPNLASHTGTGTQNHGFYLSQEFFPGQAEQTNQNRHAEFEPNTTNDWEVGVALRFSVITEAGVGRNYRAEDLAGVSYDGRKQGYMAVVSRLAGVFSIRIDRYNAFLPPGRVTTLASATISDPAGIFTVGFEVREGSDNGTPFASMLITYNGTVQTLSPATGYESVGNWINDYDADRIPSGWSTGFFFRRDDTVFEDAMYVSEFTKLDPTVTPPVVPPEDHPSIVMAAETDGKTGELTTPLSWDITEIPCSAHRTGVFSTGFRYSFPRYSGSRREWRVSVDGATIAEAQSLLGIVSANGWSIPFDWTRADTGESFVVHLSGDNFVINTSHQSGTVQGSFTMIELFDADQWN